MIIRLDLCPSIEKKTTLASRMQNHAFITNLGLATISKCDKPFIYIKHVSKEKVISYHMSRIAFVKVPTSIRLSISSSIKNITVVIHLTVKTSL